jgi:hypothetical protein
MKRSFFLPHAKRGEYGNAGRGCIYKFSYQSFCARHPLPACRGTPPRLRRKGEGNSALAVSRFFERDGVPNGCRHRKRCPRMRENNKCIDKCLYNTYLKPCSTTSPVLIGTMAIRRSAKSMAFRLKRLRRFFRQTVFRFLMMTCTLCRNNAFSLLVAIPVDGIFFWASHYGSARVRHTFA